MSIFDTHLAEENWRTKYQYGDETPLETFNRVAKNLAEVEYEYGATEQEVERYRDNFLKTIVKFEEIDDKEDYSEDDRDVYIDLDGTPLRAIGLKCTPGGRITANIGTKHDGTTLLNCFIASPVSDFDGDYNTPEEFQKLQEGESICELNGDKTPDDLVNIGETLTENALTLKSEGGWGINFGFIRPRGSYIDGTGTRHPGVPSYMELFDKMSHVITKGCEDGYEDEIENHLKDTPFERKHFEKAQSRKGAMMGVMPCWHPDIEEFIKAKQEPGVLTKFNISVLVDDRFMEAVENDELYDLHFDGEVYKKVRAPEVYDLIMESTYNRGEPGVIMFDNMNRQNPLLYLGPDDATNPCSEVGGSSYTDRGYRDYAKDYMRPYLNKNIHNIGRTTVCLLGSLNLTQYVDQNREFEWDTYREDIKTFSRMLDNVNDIGNVPLDSYEHALKKVRQFGMGINGLGSSLHMMGMTYGSEDSVEFTEKVCRIKENLTLQTSSELAQEKGTASLWDKEWLDTPFYKENESLTDKTRKMVSKNGLRNLKTTTNPPLGSSSVICDNVSNGIEPVFSNYYRRTYIAESWPEGLNEGNVKDKLEKQKEGDSYVWKGKYKGNEYKYEPHNRGLCKVETVYDYGYKWLKENFNNETDKEYIQTTSDLDIDDHLSIQSVVQEHINQGVSKTINIPNDYPFEDFKKLYKKGWKEGLVGLTTFREGTMENVLEKTYNSLAEMLIDKGYTSKYSKRTEDGVFIEGVDLPDSYLNGKTKVFVREGIKYYVTMSFLPEDTDKDFPVALWVHTNSLSDKEYVSINRAVKSLKKLLLDKGVSENLVRNQFDKIKDDNHPVRLGKAISMCLRHCIDLPDIAFSIEGVEGDYIGSTLSAVRKFLKGRIEDGTKIESTEDNGCDKDIECDLVFESGCVKCRQCGKSECG